LPVIPEAVPARLREGPWVVWRYVPEEKPDPHTGAVGWDKPPMNARTGKAASSTKRRTWSTWDEAAAAYRRGGCDGIGRVLDTTGDAEGAAHLVGIDLDDCRDPATGAVEPWALDVVRRMNTYTEVSPGARGLRLFLLGQLPPSGRKKENYENYQTGRYVTVTGQHLEGTPATVEYRQAELEEVHAHFFAKPAGGQGARAGGGTPTNLDDAEIVRRASAMKNGAGAKFAKLWRGEIAGHGSASEADLALCNYLAFWCGPDEQRIADLFVQSGLFRSKWQREDYRRRTISKALAGRTEFYNPSRGSHRDNGDNGSRPTITITTEEHEVNAEAAQALSADPSVYQRAGLLVRVVRDASPAAKGIRRPFAPRIETLPPPLLRERLTANARWVALHESKDGTAEKPARPPGWCVAAVHARGEWPDIRHLEAVVDYPVLRPDGTILNQPGYDGCTGLLLEQAGNPPELSDQPTRADALAARDALLEVVADFPLELPVHKAAWLAALLTPLARFAFVGPAPLFLADSNVRGAGKGLLLDCVCRIVTGERFTVATYTQDEDELRKRITSLALAGDRLVLFDNLDGKFGNAVLDAALTGTAWTDRILGVNRMAEAPLYMTWFATGNNVMVAADTARRACHIRLESPEEHPEERQGFRYPNLLGWVGENRPRLLAAALTILRAFCVAGRPDQLLPAWGSFEGWSGLVRSAVVWVGLPDPGETRLLLQERADVAAESFGVILTCWEQLDPDRKGLTAAEVIQRLYKQPPRRSESGESCESFPPQPENCHADMKDALEALLGKPDARGLGNRLRSYRRRVFQGRYIDLVSRRQRAARWAVFPAKDFGRGVKNTHQTHQTHSQAGESRESGEGIPPDSHGDAWEGLE
jgi:hypothetical protein